jgi:hypothetical protein
VLSEACSLAAFRASTSDAGVAIEAACSTMTVLVGTITFTERTPGRFSRTPRISGSSLEQQIPRTFMRVCAEASSPTRAVVLHGNAHVVRGDESERALVNRVSIKRSFRRAARQSPRVDDGRVQTAAEADSAGVLSRPRAFAPRP